MRTHRPLLILLLTLALFQALAGAWHAHSLHDMEVQSSWASQAPTESQAPNEDKTRSATDSESHDDETDCRCAWCAPNLHAAVLSSERALERAAARPFWQKPAHQRDGAHPPPWNASSRDPPAAA